MLGRVYVAARGQGQVFLSIIPQLILEMGPLRNPEAHHLASLASQQALGLCLSLLCSSLLAYTCEPVWLLHRCWASKLGSVQCFINWALITALHTWRKRHHGWQSVCPQGSSHQKGARSHLCVQLIHYEVAERGLEEVILCTVLQQGVIHGVCAHLGRRQQAMLQAKPSTAYSSVSLLKNTSHCLILI